MCQSWTLEGSWKILKFPCHASISTESHSFECSSNRLNFFFIILIMRWTFKIFLNYKCHVMSWTFLYPFFIFTCSYIQRKGEEEHLKKFHDTMHDFLKYKKKSYSLYNYINDRDLLYWDGIRRQERFYLCLTPN